AYNRTEEEVCEIIGADWLIYQDVEDLINAARAGNPEIKEFDASCFNGKYVTGDVSDDYLNQISILRNDDAKSKRETNEEMILDLSNGV
ncbi:MAG: amidophosphoribosyltransferase, partial [Gammaproteobacteria bacterium]|nr:amidophosphoribosyltransferase [Gammaproteobacteria bacterium]